VAVLVVAIGLSVLRPWAGSPRRTWSAAPAIPARPSALERAWDFSYENRSNVIDVYVRYLREKVDRPFGVETIETVRGAGYRLREDDGAAE